MKNVLFALIGMIFLVVSSCVDFEDEVVPEIVNQTGYSLKLNGLAVTDTAKFAINEMVLVEVTDVAGKKIVAEVNFGNGNAAITASNAADKYTEVGQYTLTATVANTNPAVILKANVLIKKAAVIVDPINGESVVLVLDSSFVNGINTITYGLKLDINGLDNSTIFVDASVPGKPWSTYNNATEIIVINGFKYVKWTVVVPNGTIRVGWYQYRTVNGLKEKEWAATSTSKFWKEGLPEFSVYNGVTYVLGTAPVSDKVFTLKLEGVTFSNDTNRVSLNTAFSAKVLDEASVLTLVDYDFGNGVKAVNVNTASNSYATPGTYKVTATIKSVTPNKVLTTWVVVPKVVIVPATYTLKINNETYANGSVIKINEGTSLMFKILNKDGVIVSSKFTSTGSAAVIADSKTIVYGAAGTFDMSIETQNDATTFAVKIEVTKVGEPVYTLKVNNVAVTTDAIKTTIGTSLSFTVVNESGVATTAVWNMGEGSPSTSNGKTHAYAKAGTYQVSATVGTQVMKVTIEVADASVQVYTLKVNNVAVANGSTVKTTAGTSMYFKTVNNTGASVLAKYDFGDNSSETTDIAAKIYQVAGTYKVTSTYENSVTTVYIEVAAVVVPDVYSFKINGTVTNGTVTIEEGVTTNFKVVNASGTSFTAKFDLGNGTKVETDNANTTYVAGSYLVTALVNGQTISKNITVTPSTIFIPKPEAIVLISSSVSGAVITAVLGLRCDAIPNMSLTKDTYVAGEIPGVNWKDYKLTETVLIDGIRYFKWNVTTGAGKFRMSWVQMKDGGTKLYDDGNWAFDLDSNYFKEGLFHFNLTIDGSKAKLAK